MYTLVAYHYNGEFAFCLDFETEADALAYAQTLNNEAYDIEIECPNNEIICV